MKLKSICSRFGAARWAPLCGMPILIVLLFATSTFAANRYVSLAGGHVSPFTNWAGASTTIQAAVDVSGAGDAIWVTNGTYYENVTNTIGATIRSANNDPNNTIINGGDVGRCVMMGTSTSSWLVGFTVMNGSLYNWSEEESSWGGGVYGGMVSNCIITANHVAWVAGGVCRNTIYNSLIVGNSSSEEGGGIVQCAAYNCSIIANYAPMAGGSDNSVLYSCLIASNSASYGGGGSSWDNLYCCTVAGNYGGGVYQSYLFNSISWGNSASDYQPNDCFSCGEGYAGVGSITNNPLFVGGGNYRLQAGSPCINAGTNQAWMTGAKDLAGHNRITGGTVDMGAYERPRKFNTYLY